MGDWIVGAFINIFGSLSINFGTNLLKLGHDERERESIGYTGASGKAFIKPIIHVPAWRLGVLFFVLGNCLNFVSFGYAAQSLLAALGSVQFVSNIAFAYFVLNRTATIKVLVATAFIVLGNIFLVAFGNHQSPVYTPEQLAEKYGSTAFLIYCLILVIVVCLNQSIYRRGELLLAIPGNEVERYWHMLLPLSYAIVSGAVGSCSVLFAKSLSNLLRLSISSVYQLHNWFTYSLLLLFLCTAGFWMARLNEGLSLFDAILIVPMFQIVWTFFSIGTGFVYFQEYQGKVFAYWRMSLSILLMAFLALVVYSFAKFFNQYVFDALRTTMFIVGVLSVFIGISLLAPDESKGGEINVRVRGSATATSHPNDEDRNMISKDAQIQDKKSLMSQVQTNAANLIAKTKAACSLSLGLGEESMHTSSVFVMPMVSSKITGFRGNSGLDKTKLVRPGGDPDWSILDEDGEHLFETTKLLP